MRLSPQFIVLNLTLVLLMLGTFATAVVAFPLRRIAVAERIRVVGFLGLLIAAAQRGILSQSQARLAIDDAISKHGCRISIGLYQRLLSELGC